MSDGPWPPPARVDAVTIRRRRDAARRRAEDARRRAAELARRRAELASGETPSSLTAASARHFLARAVERAARAQAAATEAHDDVRRRHPAESGSGVA